MKCPICKGQMASELRDFQIEHNGEQLIIEDVPTWVCERCDEVVVDDDVIEAVEEMLVELEAGLADREDLPEIDLSE